MSDHSDSRSALPIERGFPIEQVNDLADREGRAKLHYRPLTTMHKWWARRLGSVFRAITLYSLVSDPDRVRISDPNKEDHYISDFNEGGERDDANARLQEAIDSVDLRTPDAMWDLYSKNVQVEDVDVLDPFMGGGTSLLEAIRFGATVTGVDLNPVAWFITKKELEGHTVDPDELRSAFQQVESEVAEELRAQYETACPNDESHTADIVYAFWVRELDCTSCDATVPLFKDYRVANGRYEDDDKYHVYCPECGNVFLTDDYSTETICPDCGNNYVPENGPVSQGGNYGCPSCGLKYPIVDAIADGQTYDESLYAIEYYCTDCDDEGKDRPTYKGYKSATKADIENYKEAKKRWTDSDELHDYAPDGEIPEGAITAASSISGNDIFQHGYETWQDMFNGRQLYCLSTLLRAIDDIESQTIKEYLLLAFTDSLMFQNNFAVYNITGRKIEGVFRRNSFTPRVEYTENNVWGTRAGRGTFHNTWQKIIDAVEFAHQPTERYIEDSNIKETDPFDKPIGGDYTLHQGDFRSIELDTEYDAIITDPPYYDNVVYSEVSDFFYVWQRLLLSDEYDAFADDLTPRDESLVANPAIDKDEAAYESEFGDAVSQMRTVLKDDGILVFTYRHGGPDSWGFLLQTLCEEGFDLTATYPISANLNEFVVGEELNFSVIVVARPATDRDPISWSSLRRRMHRTARNAREQLQEGQTISEGDISVVEMGRCFREYSAHHGKVHREGDVMTAREVVDEIYDILAGDISPDDIYLDLLAIENPTYDDVERLCRGTEIDPADLEERVLFVNDDEFTLTGWNHEDRLVYLRGKDTDEMTPLEKVQLLRFDAAQEAPAPDDRQEIDVTGAMIDTADELATLTNDDRYADLFGG